MIDPLQTLVHYSLHLLAPGLLAWMVFRDGWKRAWGVMMLTMAVDLDHLMADPLFDPERCSIGTHPLHTVPAMSVYGAMLFHPVTRVVGSGLLLHMAADGQDCVWMEVRRP